MNLGKAVSVVNDIDRGNPLKQDVKALCTWCSILPNKEALAKRFLVPTAEIDQALKRGQKKLAGTPV